MQKAFAHFFEMTLFRNANSDADVKTLQAILSNLYRAKVATQEFEDDSQPVLNECL